jgi:hypothetical protein
LPEAIYNRPGLPALDYRIGTYGTFLSRMLNRLSAYALPDGDRKGERPLARLSTRELDDPSVAFLDATAVVADVLTFYQERIANEGFLRTSVERQSILELARAIGYQLQPGVAASTYLAFTIEEAPGAPTSAEIPVGMKVQSVPSQGKLPQTFETIEKITARKEWNAIRPRLTLPQYLTIDIPRLYLAGTSTNLKVGDRLLIVVQTKEGTKTNLALVHKVVLDQNNKRTQVDLSAFPLPIGTGDVALPIDKAAMKTAKSFDGGQIVSNIVEKTWPNKDLSAFMAVNHWDAKNTGVFLDEHRKLHPDVSGGVYAMRAIVGFFGHNAPLWDSLPKDSEGRVTYPGNNWDIGGGWGDGWPIWWNQQTGGYYKNSDLYLERVVDGLLPESWIVIASPGVPNLYYKIDSAIDRSRAAFALSAKLTGLRVKKINDDELADTEVDKPSKYVVRASVAYVKSELLPLSERPWLDNLSEADDTLQLNSLVLGLAIGQAFILTGERSDAEGVIASELHFVKDIRHAGGYTTLILDKGLKHSYKRDTVTINANVALATHGETTTEILGNGAGAQINQRFTLRKPPLTYVSAATPSGTESTLEVRVNNLLWTETSSLYPLGPNDQQYLVRTGDDGKSTVIFGDGKHGARLPTGTNNVVAKYRSGIGLDGEVEAGSLTTLASKPLGVKGASNPLPATGADDPEKMDNARQNAPLTTRTLDRMVSLVDYEDFARAFAGIGKAQSIELWNGPSHLVHLTIAGADGEPIEPDSQVFVNLVAAINTFHDAAQRVCVDSFELLLFNVHANVALDKRYIQADVLANIQTALQNAFSFEQRSFGQPVTAAEVMTIIQRTSGVIAVDLDALNLASEEETLKPMLSSHIARVEGGVIQLAQLLLINSAGITLGEMQP